MAVNGERGSYAKAMNAFRTIKETCLVVWGNAKLVCQNCPFHVKKSDRTLCYWEHIGGLPPREWKEDDLRCLI